VRYDGACPVPRRINCRPGVITGSGEKLSGFLNNYKTGNRAYNLNIKILGLFLYHCHNLEHGDMGMMRNYLVEKPNAAV
jgi:FtsP/CotA-like multicopper oxidase with cupredoxin domain